MKPDPARLALALGAAGCLLLSACGDGTSTEAGPGPVAGLASTVASGPESAAEFIRLLTGGAQVDYVPTESVADAIAMADVIVTGKIVDVTDHGDHYVVIKLEVDEVLHGQAASHIHLGYAFPGTIAGVGRQLEVTVDELVEVGVGLRAAVGAVEAVGVDAPEHPADTYQILETPAVDSFFLRGTLDTGMHCPYLGYPVSIWGAETIDAYAELIREAR